MAGIARLVRGDDPRRRGYTGCVKEYQFRGIGWQLDDARR